MPGIANGDGLPLGGSGGQSPPASPAPPKKVVRLFSTPLKNRDGNGGRGGAKRSPGHRFFPDDEREIWARFIDWALTRQDQDAWFATLTFRDYVSPEKARRMVNRWLARINQSLGDKGAGRLRWILASEWQVRKVIHYHLLLLARGLDTLSRKGWECRWHQSGGGFCRIYNAERKSAPYLAKYLNKERGGELEMGGSWQGYRCPASVAWGIPMEPRQ